MSSVTNMIELNSAVERGVKNACVEFSTKVVHTLADRFGFDIEEAMRALSLNDVAVSHPVKKAKSDNSVPKKKKSERDVPKMVLPFCGVMEGWCKALRFNHGLYTQCTNEVSESVAFCATCLKQTLSNANEKPNFGTIADRLAVGPMEYVDPKGKKVVSYANVMAKLKLTREAAIAEAARFGWAIPEEQFELKQRPRGRPKSAPVSSESDSEKPKKARGRPKKEKAVGAATNIGDNLLAALARQATEEDGASDADVDSDEAKATAWKEAADCLDAEKAAKDAKAAEKEAAKAAKAAAALAEKEAAKAAKAAAKEAEKEAKAAAALAEKAAKAAAREAEKAAKAAAREAEREAAKAAKAAEKAAKKATGKKAGSAAPSSADEASEEAVAAVAAPKPVVAAAAAAESEDEEEEEEELVLTRRVYKGKNYYVDPKTNQIYDPESQDVIGSWNTETNKPEIDE